MNQPNLIYKLGSQLISTGLIAIIVIAGTAMLTGCVEKDTTKTIEYDASKDL